MSIEECRSSGRSVNGVGGNQNSWLNPLTRETVKFGLRIGRVVASMRFMGNGFLSGLGISGSLCDWDILGRSRFARYRSFRRRLRGHVFRDQFGLEADDGVAVGDDGLGVVLCLVAGAARRSGDDEGAFAG